MDVLRTFRGKRSRPRRGAKPVRKRVATRRRLEYGAIGHARWIPVFAAIAGGFFFLALSNGGRAVREADPLLVQFDRFIARIGLGLDVISVSGLTMTSDADVFTALNLDQSRSLISVDTQAARERIEKLPWVATAQIRQTFPQRLDIVITERQPFALWTDDTREILVDRSGRRLAQVRVGAIRSLPLIAGAGAPALAGALLDQVSGWPDVLQDLRLAKLIDGRRWNLMLTHKRLVMLPEHEHDIPRALSELSSGPTGQRFIDRRNAVIDLRFPSQTVVRLRQPLTQPLASQPTTARATGKGSRREG